jgi:acyl-CoA thioester hydrolase
MSEVPGTRPFIHRLRVRYAECDPQGVLFNANYLAYIDHTITELWRAAYGGYQAMLDRGLDIVVAEVKMRFRGSARFDEEVIVEATVTHLGTTSVTTAYRFRRADGELLLEAEIRHVWIDRGTATKTPMPDWAREGLAPWRVEDTGASPRHTGAALPDTGAAPPNTGAAPPNTGAAPPRPGAPPPR